VQLTRENSVLRERLRATEAACEQREVEVQAATREKVDTLLLLSQTEERQSVERDSVDTLQQRNSMLRERLLQVTWLNEYRECCWAVDNTLSAARLRKTSILQTVDPSSWRPSKCLNPTTATP